MKILMKYTISGLLIVLIAALFAGCEKGPNYKLYTYPAGTAAGISPVSGYPGINVTITGKDFGTLVGAVKVYFGGVLADTVRTCTDNQIVVKVPAKAISGKVTLKIWTTTIDSVGIFTVIPAPVIKSVSAAAAAPGDVLKISGTGFGTSTSTVQVGFNGVNGTVTAVTADTLITVTVPSGFTSGPLTVYVNNYPVQGPSIAYLVAVPAPVYQLDFEGNLNATIGSTASTYIQGTAQPLTYVSGINGQAAYLAGYTSTGWADANQAISLPQNIAQYNELTISFWIQYDGTGTNANWGTPAYSIGHTRGNNIALNVSTGWPDMNHNISSAIVFENVTGFTGYNAYSVKTSATIKGSAWHHLCVTYSKTSLKAIIYSDGAQIGTITLPSAYDLSVYAQDRNYLGVGCVSNTNEPALKGGIDKFQVYNTALTANQVYTVYYKK